MKVVKKLGYRQEFDINKIKIALKGAAKSINQKFLNSDWKELKPRIESRLEPIMKGREEIFFWEIDEAVIDSLLRSRFNEITKMYIKTRSDVIKDKLNDMGLSPFAMDIMKERYLRKDDNGEPIETARELMCRVASAVASAEPNGLRENYTELFSEMLLKRNFLPNSPALVSAGTKHRGTLAACFAFSIEDSLDDILDCVKKTAKTFQLGGGVGVSIAKLREKGSKIYTTNGYSSGSVEFLNLFDTMCTTIKTGGFRRGALMCLTEYNHPDIEWFIHCKRDVDKLNNMNISVLVDNAFFDAVKDDKDIILRTPKTGEKVDSIPAQLLLEHIATNIWESGEPGILYGDAMEKANPTPHLGQLKLTNPCLIPNTLITTEYAQKPVTDIKVGDVVINHYGTKCNVINTMKRKYKGEIYTFKINSNQKLSVTPEHPIFISSAHRTGGNKFIEAKNIKVGDYLTIPKFKYKDDTNVHHDSYLLRLFGYFLSEGSLSGNNGRLHTIEFDFHKDEIEYIDEVRKSFKRYFFKDLKISKSQNCTRLRCSSKKICEYFYDLFGKGSKTKYISDKIMSEHNVNLLNLVETWFNGDGHLRKCGNSRQLCGKTISKTLAQSIFDILIKAHLKPTLTSYTPKNKNEQESYTISLFGKDINRFYNRKERNDSYLKYRIKDIIIDSYDGYVYNLEVDGKYNSYLANSFGCHNCSESNLLNNEACVLGSINLVNHMIEDKTDMDWDRLAETTKLSTRFLDDMLDASPYPTLEIEKMVKSTRKIGIGIMGFADILIHMGIKYSSKQAIEMAGKIMAFINDVADQESIALGKEKGLYLEYKSGYRKRRNAITTVIAPTGTLSLIAGVSPGVEPNFYKEYSRIIDNRIVNIIHPLKDSPVFESCTEIPPEQHLKMLAEFQKHTENSVSKTINAPEDTSVEDVKKLIIQAHKLGVKGITILRENSKREPLIRCEDCKI